MKQKEKDDLFSYWYHKDLRLSDDVVIMKIGIDFVNVMKLTIWKVL